MDKCLQEKTIRTRGQLIVTVHVCGLNKRHRGKHVCRRIMCTYCWKRQVQP